MHPQPHIRIGTERDLATLVEFNQAMARETEARELAAHTVSEGVSGLLRNPHYGFYLVAEVDGETVGSLMVTFEWSDWRNALFWWIQSVYVKPGFRRRGVYRRLYAEVKERARRQGGVCGFRLYVERENRSAQRTYGALGMNDSGYLLFEELLPSAGAHRMC